MLVIDILEGELLEEIRRAVKDADITHAAVVSLIGAVDSFAVTTMPLRDATKNVMTDYAFTAEVSGIGEIINGEPHLHVVMAVEGARAVAGHLHRAEVHSHSVRAYVLPAP
jgi:uncharacterized protein